MSHPAVRAGDRHTCPMVEVISHVGGPVRPPCSPNVFINNLGAARLSDAADCVGNESIDIIIAGSADVLINDLPAVRVWVDRTLHGGWVLEPASPDVFIGGASYEIPSTAHLIIEGSPSFQAVVVQDLYFLTLMESGRKALEGLQRTRRPFVLAHRKGDPLVQEGINHLRLEYDSEPEGLEDQVNPPVRPSTLTLCDVLQRALDMEQVGQ